MIVSTASNKTLKSITISPVCTCPVSWPPGSQGSARMSSSHRTGGPIAREADHTFHRSAAAPRPRRPTPAATGAHPPVTVSGFRSGRAAGRSTLARPTTRSDRATPQPASIDAPGERRPPRPAAGPVAPSPRSRTHAIPMNGPASWRCPRAGSRPSPWPTRAASGTAGRPTNRPARRGGISTTGC